MLETCSQSESFKKLNTAHLGCKSSFFESAQAINRLCEIIQGWNYLEEIRLTYLNRGQENYIQLDDESALKLTEACSNITNLTKIDTKLLGYY